MKVCIFCGQKPQSKTKEHVIPKWLIEMTGDPGRTTLLGKYRDTLRKFPWKNFTFPACENCNNEYAGLESRAKNVVSKLLVQQDIIHEEINDLLDWLDKIRVGIWLGHIQLDKQDDLTPNFYIKHRIGISDRLASIYYINDNQLGIGYTATELPAFRTSPSCFTLFINNIAIFNFSKEFAFSRRLGFPYPNKMLVVPNESKVKVDFIHPGNERIMRPIIRKNMLNHSSNIYQAIINPASGSIPNDFETSYYNRHITNGRSRIYAQNNLLNIEGFVDQVFNSWTGKAYNRVFLQYALAIQTLDFQNYALKELLPSFELLDKNERTSRNKFYRDNVATNIYHIKKLKKDWLDSNAFASLR